MTLPSAASVPLGLLSRAKHFSIATHIRPQRTFATVCAGISAVVALMTESAKPSRKSRRREPKTCRTTHGPMQDTGR